MSDDARSADAVAGMETWNMTVAENLIASELSEGMRVKMPSGQVLTVTAVSEPDSNGVVRVTYDAEEAGHE